MHDPLSISRSLDSTPRTNSNFPRNSVESRPNPHRAYKLGADGTDFMYVDSECFL